LNAGLAFDDEDDAFADIRTMIGNPFQFVGYPEQIGGTL
jgi:hypothetical protein